MYPWTRFWLPRDSIMHLQDGVFLWDPEDPLDSGLVPGARALDAIDDRVAVLLGEPGMGKTTTVASFAASAGAIVLGLSDYVSVNELREDLDSIVPGDDPVTVVFDGLDEAMIRQTMADKWLPSVLRRLPAETRDRIRVRITCRPAIWPEQLTTALCTLWPDSVEGSAAYNLAPLRRRDVQLAAVATGVDGEGFLVGLESRDLLAFAARPVTLLPLLHDFAEGRLPSGKTEVYASMCDRLSRELNPGYRAAALGAPAAGPGALEVAGRLAAVSEFSGRPMLWWGADPLATSERDLDLSPGIARGGGVDDAMLRRALNTALFSSAGVDRFRFAHRTYGEFLAVEHAHRRGVASDDLLALVRDPVSSLVRPQLSEVAAWMASMRLDIFDDLVAVEPELLLRSDVATRNPTDRDRLLSAVLAAQEREPPPRLAAGELAGLATPAAAPLLHEYLFGSGHAPAARLAALDAASGLAEMTEDVVAVIESSAEPRLREAAAAQLRVNDPATAERLAQLLSPDNPITDELRGQLLRKLWPRWLRRDAMLTAVSVAATPGILTSYEWFLTRSIPANLSPGDLAAVLRWAAENLETSKAHGEAADAMLVVAVGQAQQADYEAVATIYVRRQRAYPDGWDKVALAVAQATADPTIRRPLIAAAVAFVQADPAALYPVVILGRPEDFEWALRQAGEDDTHRRTWVDAALRWFRPLDCPDHLDALTAARDNPDVETAFGDELNGVRLDSERANQMRATHTDERRRVAESAAWKAQRDRLLPSALTLLQAGDPTGWPALSNALDPKGGLELDVTRLESWGRLTESDLTRAIDAARGWVLTNPPPTRRGPNEWPGSIAHALRALWLFADDNSVLSRFDPQRWAAWAPLLAWIILSDERDRDRRDGLLIRAYRDAPEAVEQALVDELDADAARAANQLNALSADQNVVPDPLRPATTVTAHTRFDAVWNERFTDRLEDWLLRRDDDLGIAQIVPALAEHARPAASNLALSALHNEAPTVAAARRRVAAAGALLSCPDGGQHWPAIWSRWQRDEAFARAVLDRLYYDAPGLGLPRALIVGEDGLVDLYLWLHPRRPESEGAAFIDPVTRTAHAILDHLESLRTADAIAALRRLVDSLPEERDIPYRLADAERAHRAASWDPAEPAEVALLLDDPARRLINSDADLGRATLRALGHAQRSISGETPAVADLWDNPDQVDVRRPKPEKFLSDWLKRHIRDDLDSAVIAREVEITPGFDGKRKMREVDLYLAAHVTGNPMEIARVIIENKGCWNPDVLTDIKTQLVETYLEPTAIRSGIYVVFYFGCDPDQTRQCKTCRRMRIDELRHDLEKRATALCDSRHHVTSKVIDARLTITP